jgi:thioredoxin 1
MQAPEITRTEVVSDVRDAELRSAILESSEPVLVDFWAPWCAPCRAIAPVLEQLATEYAGRLRVVRVNVDDNPVTANRYEIRAIPNLALFVRGELRERMVGAVSKSRLIAAVDQALEV